MSQDILSAIADAADPESRNKFSQKILRISKAVGEIPRNGLAPDGHVYAKVEDVIGAVAPLLDKYGLLFSGSLDGPLGLTPLGEGCVRDAVLLWTLEDTRTGSTRSWRIPGSGFDFEGCGTAAALTASKKAAYIIAFNLKIAPAPEENSQEAADRAGELKKQAIEKRRLTNRLKNEVLITKATGEFHLLRGRIHVMEHACLDLIEGAGGKWSELNQGWLIDQYLIDGLSRELAGRGCKVVTE